MNHKILHYLRKKIDMLSNYINYTFIKNQNLHLFDVITKHHYIHCKYYLKRLKISKRNTLLECYFLFGQLTLYLSTLKEKNLVYWDVIFHFGLTKSSVKLKNIT